MNQNISNLLINDQPEMTVAQLSLVQANKNSVRDWLANLSMLNLGDTARQLYTTLKELSQLQTDEQTRFELIELLRPSVHTIISSLSKHYFSQNFSLDQRAQRIATLVEEIRVYLIVIYDTISMHCYQKLQSQNFGLFNIKNKKNLLDLIGLSSHRALTEMTGLLYELQSLYLTIPKGLWKKTHTLYQRALQLHLTKMEIEDKTNPIIVLSNIKRAYSRMIIMGASNTNKLRQSEIKAIYQSSILWADLISLDNTETPYHLFSIDLELDQPPVYITKRAGSPASMLFVNAQKLLQHFKNLMNQYPQYLHASEQKQFSTALKVHLVNNFSAPSERIHTRHPYSGKVDIAFGLLGIHYHLSNGKTFEDIINIHRDYLLTSDTEVKSLFGQVEYDVDIDFPGQNSLKKTEAVAEMSELYSCEIVNISPGGYCLRWQGESPTTLRTGELVVICEPSDKVWHIGLIRWVKQIPIKIIEFGIEIISSRAKICGIRASQRNDNIDSFKRAILLPEIQSLNRPATLITQAFAFHSNQRVIIRYGNEEIRAILNKEYLITQSFIQFEYTIEEDDLNSTKIENQYTIDSNTLVSPDDEVWKIL